MTKDCVCTCFVLLLLDFGISVNPLLRKIISCVSFICRFCRSSQSRSNIDWRTLFQKKWVCFALRAIEVWVCLPPVWCCSFKEKNKKRKCSGAPLNAPSTLPFGNRHDQLSPHRRFASPSPEEAISTTYRCRVPQWTRHFYKMGGN